MQVEHKIVAAFIIALVSVVLVGTGAYVNARKLFERNDLVVHTYQVIDRIDHVANSLSEAQSGGRGYLLTGKAAYLQPYQASVGALSGQIEELRGLTADNPIQQRNIDRLQSAANRAVGSLQRELAAQQPSAQGAAPAVAGTEDKENMDQVRFVCAEMRAEENRLLDQRVSQTSEGARHTLTNFILLLGLTMILLIGFYIFIRHDLAVRRRADEVLRERDRRFRAVMESAPDAMIIADAEQKIQLINAQAERLFGYTRDEFAGRELKSLLVEREVPTPQAETVEPSSNRLAQDRAFEDLKSVGARLNGIRKDGTTFPIDLSRSALDIGSEHLVITAIRDRTEQERATEAVRKFSLDLTRSNAELERFAYVASHDLQEPLRMVSSYTQLLSKRYKGKLDANADEFIAYAVDGATRMQKLINDLLALSRVGTQARPNEPVDTRQVLTQVLSDLHSSIENAGAKIIYPEAMPTVLADGTQIGQLFQNLVGNALKFRGPDAPRIEITAQPTGEGSFWQFTFKDNGIGIEPQYFERIFVIFQRLHNKESYPGTGIGLAICKKIVERHEGQLWVESAPGSGTTFLFTLPVVS